MSDSILLFTKNIESAKQEITALGGQITHQFTETVFVAKLPESVKVKNLKDSTTKKPSTLDDVSDIALKAWKGMQSKATKGAAPPTEGLRWDTPGYKKPNHPDDEEEDSDPQRSISFTDILRSTGTPTSLYMTGSVAVGVVIVSGTQNELKLSAGEKLKVIQEVQEALDFLANAEPRAHLSFVYDIRIISVSAAPGSTHSYEAAEGPWRNAALHKMGYTANRQGSRDYVRDLQQSKGTNWAYVAYFTKYPLRHFAYAVSEKTVMHYDNDGWGPDNINRVFAHETCHIFGAADEYGSCSCAGSYGYLGIANNNCRNCPGTQENCLMDGNVLQLCNWSRGQIGWDERLFPLVFPPLSLGNYTIQQKSNSRYLDAHESSAKDFSVVTRTKQNNDTQRWRLVPMGAVYTIQQKSNGRFMDAHTSSTNDFSVVTRNAQNNNTQRWVLLPSAHLLSTYTIQQLSNGRFLDAHEHVGEDFSAVTRSAQHNNSQLWVFNPLGDNTFTLQHLVNGRFLDAHESSANDFSVVTRAKQNNDTQRWIFTPIGGVYSIQQLSSGRFMDAHTSSANDFSAVTRRAQNNNTQYWVILAQGDKSYTIQQLNNGRFIDAHESSANDYSVVTRTTQNNNSQRWTIKSV